jgi:basic membrane protein A and related proteins
VLIELSNIGAAKSVCRALGLDLQNSLAVRALLRYTMTHRLWCRLNNARMKSNRLTHYALFVLACCSCLIGVTYAQSPPLKVAFVYVGPVGDGGWSYQHDLARRAVEKAFGAKVKTTYVESVAEGADSERVIRRLAASGSELIFTTSFGFMEPTLKVARQFPKVKFEHATGFKTAPNMSAYEVRFYEGAYLLGVVAGGMTKTNTIGFIGSHAIPEVVRNINAFTLGARSVNPKVQTKVIWVDTWYDPGKERQAAETLIAQGADVLSQNTDSPAAVQVAQEKGKYAFGWDSDQERYGPKAHLTANTQDWSVYYNQIVKQTLSGTWKGGRITRLGLRDKAIVLSKLNPAVPADVAAVFEAKKAAIASGEFTPFAGPIKDNTGKIKVAAGKSMSDDELTAFNWYVEGVIGSIGK